MSHPISRIEDKGILRRSTSPADRRRQLLTLTDAGRDGFRRLVGAMARIRTLLERAQDEHDLVVLREPEPGELGWIVHRHGALYAEEYGWDEDFEALVARVVADYMERGERDRERAWIAERSGEPVGCVLCTRRSESEAQLRLLLVEPEARGIGIGARLIEQCLGFARRAGYERIALWTNDVLTDARRLYERAGFRLTEQEPHHSFGRDLVSQTWWRELRPPD